MSPRAQAATLFAAAVLPAIVALAAIAGSVLDFGLNGPMENFCIAGDDIAERPSLLLLAALLYAAVRAVRALRRVAGAVYGRDMRAIAERDGVVVTEGAAPEAFVLFGSRVYASRGLFESADPDQVRLVLEHERAHVRRKDPLMRCLAVLGCALHLGPVADRLMELLVRAQEAAADDEAAPNPEDRLRLAETMVAFARQQTSPEPGFANGHVSFRVRRLLEDRKFDNSLTGPCLGGISAVLAGMAVAGGHAMHWAVQVLVRLP
jgi:Zn-dependent protease with chaperone function